MAQTERPLLERDMFGHLCQLSGIWAGLGCEAVYIDNNEPSYNTFSFFQVTQLRLRVLHYLYVEDDSQQII